MARNLWLRVRLSNSLTFFFSTWDREMEFVCRRGGGEKDDMIHELFRIFGMGSNKLHKFTFFLSTAILKFVIRFLLFKFNDELWRPWQPIFGIFCAGISVHLRISEDHHCFFFAFRFPCRILGKFSLLG